MLFIKELDISNFNIDNVTDMGEMFYRCSELNKINIKNFNIKKNAWVRDMFYGCNEELKNKMKEENKSLSEQAFYD